MSNRQLASGPTPMGPLPDELFQPLGTSALSSEQISRPALSYFQDALQRLRQNKIAVASFFIIVLVTLIGIIGPFFFPHATDGVPFENQQNPNNINQGPTKGEVLRIVDDFTTQPEDLIDTAYDMNAARLPASALTPPTNFKINDTASVNAVTLVWDSEPGVSGYTIYRMTVPSDGNVQGDALINGTTERGVNVTEITNPAQHSYTDALGLDSSEAYAYTILPFVDDPSSGQHTYGGKAALATTKLVNTIKLSDALTIDPAATVGSDLTGRAHVFGTDSLGRDVLARMVQGTRVDMLLSLLVPTLCIAIGLFFGAFAGLVGGKIDTLFMRICEVFDNFPELLVFIILQVAIGKGTFSLVVALSAFSWANFARLVRGEVLRMRELEFVQASRLLGAPISRLIMKHIGPNLLGIIIISWSARIPGVIATEAFLSFLGLGLEQPTPSWGNVVLDAAKRLQVDPIQFFLPAAVLAVTLLAFYLLGDAMRDAFDPKLRGRT